MTPECIARLKSSFSELAAQPGALAARFSRYLCGVLADIRRLVL